MSETLPSLTANGQKLIDRLLTLPQGWVTAAMLAESIGVSRRTVLRELPSVEQWIAAAGYRFVRSPGQGLLLDEPPARREQMRALLNGSTVYAELPRRQRRQKLLGMLLQAREPMKTAALARELLVSESTLAADLDEIGQWASSYAVTLHRRPGVGVWLKGEKLSCRRAAAALLQSSLTEEELQAVLRGNFAAGGAFAALLNTKIAERVWQVLQQFEQKEKLRLPDAGFLTLATCLRIYGRCCCACVSGFTWIIRSWTRFSVNIRSCGRQHAPHATPSRWNWRCRTFRTAKLHILPCTLARCSSRTAHCGRPPAWWLHARWV